MAKRMGMERRLVVKTLTIISLLATVAIGDDRLPSGPFTAVSNQGRPLAGATVSVTDSIGDPVTACSNAACTGGGQTQVNASGVFQFWAEPGTYHVTISASGVSRTYTINIAAGAADAITNGDFDSTSGWMRRINPTPGNYTAVKVNLSGVSDPTVNDDAGDGYSIGSFWVNTSSNVFFVCTDASPGAAQWAASGGTGNIATINGEDGPAITFQFGTSGSAPNISIPSADVIQLNIPDASDTKKGLMTTGSQTFAGTKTFSGALNANAGVIATTTTYSNALFISPSLDRVGFFTFNPDTYNGAVVSVAPSGQGAAFVGVAGDGDGIEGIGSAANTYGVFGNAPATSTGAGIRGSSDDGDARAGLFSRSTSAGTVPIVQVTRNNSSDSTTMLSIEDSTGTSAATYAFSYKLNSVVKNGFQTNGQIAATDGSAATAPGFTFIGDTNSGLDEVAGIPCLVDETIGGLCFDGSGGAGMGHATVTGSLDIATANNPALTIINLGTGEDITVNGTEFVVHNGGISFSDVASDDQKVLCVKSDGFIGICSGAYSSGACTCA